jgi:5,10-methylenetetrahydrofolate reductase
VPDFEVICEVEPSTRADLMHVRHQIGVLSKVASAFLIPDNHLGRATISSVAVAHEVELMGGRSVACLNARDRNLLGFRRDLLTAAAYGVDQFLLVYGDAPTVGARSGDLTVRTMLEELRAFSDQLRDPAPRFRAGVTSRLVPLPGWKRDADFLFVQVGSELDDLQRWRERTPFDGRVYAGVMVFTSAAMAAKITAQVPQITVPAGLLDRLEHDPDAGVALACEQVVALRECGAFDGVHLVPVGRYREVAARLEAILG